jgi:hypothetical protein
VAKAHPLSVSAPLSASQPIFEERLLEGALKAANEAPRPAPSDQVCPFGRAHPSPEPLLREAEPVVHPATVSNRNWDELITMMTPAFARGRRGHFHLGGVLHSHFSQAVPDLLDVEARYLGSIHSWGFRRDFRVLFSEQGGARPDVSTDHP